MRRPASDDTVLVPPRRGTRPAAGRAFGIAAALGLVALLGAGGAWWAWRPPAAAPAWVFAPEYEPIPLATEAAIRDGSPAVRTALRFAANPAVVVLDFPTLAEQGRMLNRVAAWAEKAGVPHDRLLSDAELDAAIRASGATPETYYYGHDYAGKDLHRFFDLADRAGFALRPEEGELRRLLRRAEAEPAGLGALITIPRADAANAVTPSARATILHHELSHGEYFTNGAYAAAVDAVWRSVLTEGERAAVRTYLVGEGYDPALEDLMKNEMQAYLLHTPDPAFFDPARLGIPPARLAQIRASLLAATPPGWLRDAAAAHAPRRRPFRQRPGRVSRTTAAGEARPPRRRRASMAA